MIKRPEILVYGDPRLRQRAGEVDDPTDCAELAERMLELMGDHRGVGLAATQIGDNRRVVVWRQSDETRVLINPVLRLGDEVEVAIEGCLSVPGMAGDVSRSVSARVEGLDLSGQVVEFDAEGLEARVLQHEVDHLDGVLFIDKAVPGTLRPSQTTEAPGI